MPGALIRVGLLLALPLVAAQSCSCASDPPASDDDLLTCSATGDPHMYTFDGSFHNWHGNGLYQLVSSRGECGCSTHDDVEIQTFQCGAMWEGGRNEGAASSVMVAIKADDAVLVVDGLTDQMLVTGASTATFGGTADFDTTVGGSNFNEVVGATGGVTVTRERKGFNNLRRWAWRVRLPGGGSVLVMQTPVRAVPGGGMLNIWTSLPKQASTSGLCTECCKTGASCQASIPFDNACSAFEAGFDYVGYDVGSCFSLDASSGTTGNKAWDCSTACKAQYGADFFTFGTDDSCCCKSSDAGRTADASVALAGGACLKPCGMYDSNGLMWPEHCLPVKASEALVPLVDLKPFEETCALTHSTRPSEEPQCACNKDASYGSEVDEPVDAPLHCYSGAQESYGGSDGTCSAVSQLCIKSQWVRGHDVEYIFPAGDFAG